MHNEIISNIAQLLLNRNKIKRLPVPIASIAKKYCFLKIFDIPFDLDGVVITDKSNKTVLINSRVHRNRRRFTLAHELGHVVIPWHTGVIIEGESSEELDDSLNSPEIEKEADCFAAEILLPEKIVHSYIKKYETNISELVYHLATDGLVSMIMTVFRVFEFLPVGYTFVIVNSKNIVEYSGKTKDTLVTVPIKGSVFDEKFIDDSFKRSTISKGDLSYMFLKLESKIRKRKGKNVDWKNLLDKIIEDNIPEEERYHILQSLNGVVGAFNSKKRGHRITYPVYLDQLIAAIQSHKNLSRVYLDPRFDDYIKRKANSLYKD